MHNKNKLNLPYLLNTESAQYYECSYSCDHALVLVCGDEKFFFTDGRYDIEAKACVHQGVEVIKTQDLIASVCQFIIQNKIVSLIYDPLHTSVLDFERMRSLLLGVELQARVNFHQELRKVKTNEEVEKIRRSQTLNKEAFKKFADFLQTSEGKNEKELHFLAQAFLSQNGQYSLSFDPIFALNGNGAKAHALPDATSVLQKGDWILFDAGIKYERYCSDMTRCAYFDHEIDFFKSQTHSHSEFQKIYEVVREAKEYAIENLREGMKAKEIDALARSVIEKRGFGQYFTHSTGHGIGLDIHELPRISPKSDEIVSEGMVFSVEPGIYLAHQIGVRLEDLVVIKNGRAEVL